MLKCTHKSIEHDIAGLLDFQSALKFLVLRLQLSELVTLRLQLIVA